VGGGETTNKPLQSNLGLGKVHPPA
jgi:hypothetical protein